MCAYHVTLAIGNARRHDTGQRIRMDVLAPSKSDAAVLAEKAAEPQISPYEYAYARQITPALANASAMALAA